MSEANITSAVRMAATVIEQQLLDGRIIPPSPNTLRFVLDAVRFNKEQIVVPIPDANPATLLKISQGFVDIESEYDELMGDTE